jgi:hypothetical protein
MIQIFNKIIFGSDAEAFLALDVNSKVNFIKKYTNQQNDDLINEFLTNLPMYKSQGENCIGCKLSNDGKNISKTNAVEVATSSEPTMVGESSSRDNTERPRQTKRKKG